MSAVSASNVGDISDEQIDIASDNDLLGSIPDDDIIADDSNPLDDGESGDVGSGASDAPGTNDGESGDNNLPGDNGDTIDGESEEGDPTDPTIDTEDSSDDAPMGSVVISGSSTQVVKGENFTITLKDNETNELLSGKNLTVTFNGKTYNKTTDSKGTITLTLNDKVGTYTINVNFAGDESYSGTSKSFSVSVVKISTSFVNSGKYVTKGKTYSVTLKDKHSKVLANKTVKLTLNGKTYNKTTNAKGVVSITVNGKVGKSYTLSYKFAGDSDYKASSGSVSIKVRLATNIVGSGSRIVKGSSYKVTLKDANGKVLTKKKIVFTFNGKTYNRTTNSKGYTTLYINSASGKTYNLSYKYGGSSYHAPYSNEVSLYIKNKTAFVKKYNSVTRGTYYSVSLKDVNGQLLANKKVVVTYRKKTYNLTTNAKGVASLRIYSPAGNTYKYSYKFNGDSKYGPSSGSVNLKIKMGTNFIGSGSTIIKGSSYKVTLKDANKKVLAKKKVVFTFNGKTYNRTTNSKGYTTLYINSAAGKTYKLSYKYSGDSYYASSNSGTIDLRVKLSSSIKNGGTSVMNDTYYKVTLKDGDGNPIVNKTITFTFNGKTYKNTTDSKGVAGLKTVLSTPKKSNLTYKFAGDSLYNGSSGSVNLNVKSEKMFTIAHILAASASLKSYVESEAKVPATVTVNGVKVNFTSFTYLMSKALNNISAGKTSGIINVVNVSSNYSNKGSASVNAKLYKANYTKLTNKIIHDVENNHAIPNSVNTSAGLLSPKLYAFGLAKILVYYNDNKVLPNYCIMNSNDVNGVVKRGNSSQFKKGLNEVASLNASQNQTYLKASGNDAINAAIKNLAANLVAGKTTTWSKALAIYNYVRDNISYSYYADSVKGAATTLSTKSGNCCDQANLVVALCRAANVTARFSHAQGCTFSSGLVTGHVWAQIYVDGAWYSADATSSRNELGNIHNWNVNSFNTLKQYAHLPF